MKIHTAFVALLAGSLPLRGDEKPTLKWDVEIPNSISNVKPPEPAPEPINFEVLASRTERIDVIEAPEMSGLPPIKGAVNVTVQMVKDPGLPDPPLPPPALSQDDPAVIARLDELRKNYHGAKFVCITATVYDHARSFLRIYPTDKAKGELTAWSNIDFNHFSSVSTYQVKNTDGTIQAYSLHISIANTDSNRTHKGQIQPLHDRSEFEIPKIPDLAASGPSFIMVAGPKDGESMKTLSQLHELYRTEGVRLENAFHAKEQATADRYAYLLANPPVPKDIMIRFWQREQPSNK